MTRQDMIQHRIARGLALSLLLSLSPLTEAARQQPPHPAPAATRNAGKTAQPATSSLSIGYLSQSLPTARITPFFEPVITDEGLQGARLGLADNNTTGAFTHQTFRLDSQEIPADADPAQALGKLISNGNRLILLNLPAQQINQLAKRPEAKDLVLLDIASHDDQLRGDGCQANVFHLLPSHAMLADALSQYLSKKRWQKWFLAVGNSEQDRHYADALKASARKFGHKIVTEKAWAYTFDDRRTPESEIPVFTQGDDYDVVVVADTDMTFGDALPYRTWRPRPVIGTSGLTAAGWQPTHDAWGALQLQTRFREQAGRPMTEQDYGAWLAVRAIGEAAARSNSLDTSQIRAYLLNDGFTLAGFKGVPLSFRHWDHQLRQPVLLSTDRSLVAVAPIEGYLHPKNELDTLGTDEPESTCHLPTTP